MGYSRLEPGRELEVREYISFQRGRDGTGIDQESYRNA